MEVMQWAAVPEPPELSEPPEPQELWEPPELPEPSAASELHFQ